MTENDQMSLWLHWLIAIMLSVSGIGFAIAMGSSTIAQISTENWEEGTYIPLNAPGGEIAIETLEILNSEGEVLY